MKAWYFTTFFHSRCLHVCFQLKQLLIHFRFDFHFFLEINDLSFVYSKAEMGGGERILVNIFDKLTYSCEVSLDLA